MQEKISLNEAMEAYAMNAVEYSKELNFDLDFSFESVKLIEDICELLYKEFPKGFIQKLYKKKPTDAQIDEMCRRLGAYVGEVLRRAYGGEWLVEDLTEGHKVITLQCKDVKVYPVNKIHKRILNGKEDDIWLFFQVVQKELV